MTYLEWLKAYDKSYITHPSRQDVWDGAWDYQQDKIDNLEERLNKIKSHTRVTIEALKTCNFPNERVWTKIRALEEIQELLK